MWFPLLFLSSFWQKRGTWTEQHIISVQNSSGASLYKEEFSRVYFCCIHNTCYIYLCELLNYFFFTYITLKAKLCAIYDKGKWCDLRIIPQIVIGICFCAEIASLNVWILSEPCLREIWGLTESCRLGAQLEIQRCFPKWSCRSAVHWILLAC